MVRSIEELESYPIRATDGDIGLVRDFYFDEKAWVVRYLLVEIGNWLSSRRILIPTLSVGRSNWLDKVIQVTITKSHVVHSPDVDARKPASRQHETDYLAYNGNADYWGGAGFREVLPSAGEIAAGYSEPEQDQHEGGSTSGSTSNWLLGERIIIPVKTIQSVNWPDATVSLDLSREVLKAAPRYDDEVRPGYWLEQPAGDVSARQR